jgi:hypothetical protein
MLKVVLLLTLIAYFASCLVYMFQPEFQLKSQDDKVKYNWNKIFRWSLIPTLFVFLVGLLYVTLFCKSTIQTPSKFWHFNGNDHMNNSMANHKNNSMTNHNNSMTNHNNVVMDNYESTNSSVSETDSLF